MNSLKMLPERNCSQLSSFSQSHYSIFSLAIFFCFSFRFIIPSVKRISQVQIYKHCNSYTFPESGTDMDALYDYFTDSFSVEWLTPRTAFRTTLFRSVKSFKPIHSFKEIMWQQSIYLTTNKDLSIRKFNAQQNTEKALNSQLPLPLQKDHLIQL